MYDISGKFASLRKAALYIYRSNLPSRYSIFAIRACDSLDSLHTSPSWARGTTWANMAVAMDERETEGSHVLAYVVRVECETSSSDTGDRWCSIQIRHARKMLVKNHGSFSGSC